MPTQNLDDFFNVDSSASLIKDWKYFDDDFLPEVLHHREDKLEKIAKHLSTAFTQQTKLNPLILVGTPGTGKTACLKKIHEVVSRNASKMKKPIKVFYLRVGNMNSSTLYRYIANDIRTDGKFTPKGGQGGVYEKQRTIEKFLDLIGESATGGKFHYIIIFDEIDKMLMRERKNLSKSVAVNPLHYFQCIELKHSICSIVCALNDIRCISRLDSSTSSRFKAITITYPKYNADELKDIIQDRIDKALMPDSVSGGAVSFLSSRMADRSGDCRETLSILKQAIIDGQESNATMIEESHIREGEKKFKRITLLTQYNSLPLHYRLILKSVLQKWLDNKKREIESQYVYDYYKTLCTHLRQKEDPLESRTVWEYVNTLQQMGFINVRKRGLGRGLGVSNFLSVTPETLTIMGEIENEEE